MKNPTRKAFTLLELLLYISIAGAMLLAVSGALMLTLEAGERGRTIAEVEHQGRFAIISITQAIRNANSVSAPVGGASDSSITLQVSDAAKNPTVIDVAAGMLRIKEGTGVPINLTSAEVKVNNFTLTNLAPSGAPGSIRIAIDLARINSGGRREYDYTQTFYATADIRP